MKLTHLVNLQVSKASGNLHLQSPTNYMDLWSSLSIHYGSNDHNEKGLTNH